MENVFVLPGIFSRTVGGGGVGARVGYSDDASGPAFNPVAAHRGLYFKPAVCL